MRTHEMKIRAKLTFLIVILISLMGNGCFSLGMAGPPDEHHRDKKNVKIDINTLVTRHTNEENWYGIIEDIKEITYEMGNSGNHPQQAALSFETLDSIGKAYRYASQDNNMIHYKKYNEQGFLFFVYCASIFPHTKISSKVQAIGYMWLDFFAKLTSFEFEGGLRSYKGEMREKALTLDETIGDFFNKFNEANQKLSFRRGVTLVPINTTFLQTWEFNKAKKLNISLSLTELKELGGSTVENGKSSPLPVCLSEPNDSQEIALPLKDQLIGNAEVGEE